MCLADVQVLPNHNTPGTQLEKCLGRCAYQYGIRVHLDAGDVLHEIRFEQDRPVAEGQLKQAKRPREGIDQALRVLNYRENRDARSRGTSVAQKHFFWQESSGCDAAHRNPRSADKGSPSIEFDHVRTSKTLLPSAASSANTQAASVQISSVPTAFSTRTASSSVARPSAALIWLLLVSR